MKPIIKESDREFYTNQLKKLIVEFKKLRYSLEEINWLKDNIRELNAFDLDEIWDLFCFLSINNKRPIFKNNNLLEGGKNGF